MQGKDEVDDSLQAWGASAPPVDASRYEEDEPETFDVWPENWPTVEMFLRCQTQWIVAGMGGIVGMNYHGVQVVLAQYNVTDPEIFEGIQTMELAAMGVINRVRK